MFEAVHDDGQLAKGVVVRGIGLFRKAGDPRGPYRANEPDTWIVTGIFILAAALLAKTADIVLASFGVWV